MANVRFIHAADFHLDAPFRGGRPGYGQIRRGDVRDSFSRTIDLAIAEHAHLLLLCGDLFEQNSVTRDTIAFLQREFLRLENTRVVLLPGNHDPLSSDSWYHAASWPPHVHLLPVQGAAAALVFFPELNVHIAGFGFTQTQQDAPDFSTLPPPEPYGYRILMLHGSLDAPPTARAYHRVTEAQLRKTGYDYIAMGHYHNPFERPGRPFIANPGSPEPLGFDETGLHGVISGELCRENNAVVVRMHRVPLSTREYTTHVVDVTDTFEREALRFALASALHTCVPQRHLPHVRLVGTPAVPPDLRTLSAWFDDSWLLYRLTDETRVPHATGMMAPESLTGVFCRLMEEQMATAKENGDEERADLLRHARHMGLEALAYGEVHLQPESAGG